MTLWVGSIPNIIIGLEADLSFTSFVLNVMPLGVILFAVTLFIFIRVFRRDFTPDPGAEFRDLEFNEWIERAIEISGLQAYRMDGRRFLAAAVLVGTIFGFVIYDTLNLTPAVVALTGGFLMMMIQCKEPSSILREIDWSTLLFLGDMFIMINGFEKIGIIKMVSRKLSNIIEETSLKASISIMWLSGLASSVVDNIPLSTSLAPVVRDLVVNDTWETLW